MTNVPSSSGSPSPARRVLLVHRFYEPDATTYGRMLALHARSLAARGHNITVVCGPPTYNGVYDGPDLPRTETRDGVRVRRMWLPVGGGRVRRIIDALLFPLSVLWHIASRRNAYDVVSVTTMPPVVMGLAATLGALRSRRTRVVYHMMDLYPEAALVQGALKPGIVARLAAYLDNFTIRNADTVIVLSEDMASTLTERSGRATISVRNNFIITPHEDLMLGRQDGGAPQRFIFAGNLGRFQGIDALIDAAGLASRNDDSIEMCFMGAGREANLVLTSQEHGAPVKLLPHGVLTDAMEEVASADYSIVSLIPGMTAVAYPSKLMTSLEVGSPVLAVVDTTSRLASFVRSNRLGVVCEPANPQSIAEGMEQMISQNWDREHIRAVGRAEFERDLGLQRWAELYGLADSPS